MPEKAPRQRMTEQPPMDRIHNFNEVPFGLTDEQAVTEASRCLKCKKPKCVEGCPVNIDIPGFIKAIEEKDFRGAFNVIKATNSLPAVCGRVCPQESQCEELCILGKKGDPWLSVVLSVLWRTMNVIATVLRLCRPTRKQAARLLLSVPALPGLPQQFLGKALTSVILACLGISVGQL